MIKVGTIDLLIATTNQGKIAEIKDGLRDLPLRFRLLTEFSGLRTVTEAGGTYKENATLKALDYSRQTGLHALADDSGLEVDALGGLPGLHSARYDCVGTSDLGRTAKLLSALEPLKASNRSARFITVMVLAAPHSESSKLATVINVSKGLCEGSIARTVRGTNGFGYDPVFIPRGYQQTFGELPPEIKNRISHRTRALLHTRDFIEGWIGKLDRVCNAS